ncbi:hypothetical protein I6A84_25920 [Frankia sp. CNm7]|uniref:Uncharacterized protein n=1 Tax=Frankia nepalensis TaxID=1836974 RepID=A0A937RF14_9ACTN|nr:hypothetical protein [Frankia nepalensis]MBL7495275.1 hypothetical protein [Frankia nepalensis]MBL7515845.1 hypothetical protein [Frankia nepalensis]MBL7521427.1 hypothetical protein [Frankia nepalensis]MBL7629002.1 hypothetical protein [Frankia nepalensis]
MDEKSWQLRQGDRLVGTLTLEEIDMFWSDCHFEPAPAWEDLRPLFAASRAAWGRGDEQAALAADEAIFAAGLILVPNGGGDPITEFLIRIDEETARFRH